MEMKLFHIKAILSIILIFFSCSENNRIEQAIAPEIIPAYVPGEIITDTNGYIEYLVGNSPIIISLPHDGEILPSNMDDISTPPIPAKNSKKVIEYFYQYFIQESNGKFPHIITNNISSNKLDPNSEISNGATNSLSQLYHNTYHSYIQTAIDSINKYYDSALLINLTAHDDDNQFIELRYLLTLDNLKKDNSELDSFRDISSIKQLSYLSYSDFHETIRGFNSMGKIIMDQRCCSPIWYTFNVTPSKNFPTPPSQNYNQGGYIIEKYGSHNNLTQKINAVDFSTPYSNHRDSGYAHWALGNILEVSAKIFYKNTTSNSLY